METEITPAKFTYMGRSFSNLTANDDSSSAFSDCNSDHSGEFTSASAQARQLWLSCAAGDANSADELIRQLVSDLDSTSIEDQKQAAMEIRLLAKNKPENRLKIARAGAVGPLISLIFSPDLQLQEYGVTAILNLSLCDENKELIADCGAIKPLVKALRTGTATAKENAACALLRLSQIDENKVIIGRSGAIPALVNLLEAGSIRGKKDASTALYSLCSVKENKLRAVKAGIVKPLIELMADFGSSMVDKSAYVLSLLMSVEEARVATVEEGGIPVLVELVEVGSQRQKEIAAAILLQLCEDSVLYRKMVAREGAIPPLVALSQSGTNRAKKKANGQAEATNRAILDGIKKRLDLAKGRWAEELPAVLWAHRTTPRRSTGESPFALAYGTDAVIPLEIGLPGVRTSAFQQGGNDEALGVNLDLLQEKRDASAIRMAAYQQELIKLHGRQVRPRPISVGDFVLRKVLGNTKDPTEGKLGPNWEGPYRVVADLGNGSFKLEDMDGREIPRTWNVFNLKRFYV